MADREGPGPLDDPLDWRQVVTDPKEPPDAISASEMQTMMVDMSLGRTPSNCRLAPLTANQRKWWDQLESDYNRTGMMLEFTPEFPE
jgi:hypothetical protein